MASFLLHGIPVSRGIAIGRAHLLTRNGRRINAKSIMGVMMLAAGKGAKVTLEADGKDEEAAVAALSALVNDKFGEGE
jgi:phosphocarrier protein